MPLEALQHSVERLRYRQQAGHRPYWLMFFGAFPAHGGREVGPMVNWPFPSWVCRSWVCSKSFELLAGVKWEGRGEDINNVKREGWRLWVLWREPDLRERGRREREHRAPANSPFGVTGSCLESGFTLIYKFTALLRPYLVQAHFLLCHPLSRCWKRRSA